MTHPEQYDRIVAIGVDMQNDFCPGGALAVAEGDRVVPVFNRLAQWVRNKNGIVALTADWHPEQTTHFDIWPRHCVADTEGAAFHPDLAVEAKDIVLRKGMGANEDAYSGFDARLPDGTKLAEVVRPKKQETVAVVIGGLATDYCVKATVLDALKQTDAGVYVIEDAIAAVNIQPNDGEQAIQEMKAARAVFMTADTIINNPEARN